MDAREERTNRAILPDLSGPAVPGLLALLATLLLGAALLGPDLADSSSPALLAAVESSATTLPQPQELGEGPLEGPPPPPREPLVAPAGAPPRIESVSFGPGPVTAAGDLRLKIHASDPDGDPVRLRTWWSINGHELETTAPVLPQAYLQRGDAIAVRVVASDGEAESAPFLADAVVVENATPQITTFPKGFDATGAFVYPIGAIDPDGDRDLQYRLLEGPSGMTVEPHEGTLTWLPGSDQKGRHPVQVQVLDGRGGLQVQAFDLVVRETRPVPADLADRTLAP